ncbi:MAG: hypothetical protein UU34_C0008G0015 [Candidatus Curtissbacteria bacterium GW2011_GWA1_41_11]|uniref:Uncharacterized protein n=1 Tax=Candidatus Curtissbacteria bacterium GW2011_GWA1_41_11 TaxID=1618409 RepID=A0A0G0UHJ1_9BACT|nr:MAG: hypothetical protein UU34_C0008G0015 [Candidatus Curtissbacteria bacterium GW2011_GWA1_41_11]
MNTIEKRQVKNKALILEQLKRTPIVQICCEKSGISRASYYRWYKDDKEFAQAADKAILEGQLLVNDLAESQLISAIRDKNLSAIVFWLKTHHPSYASKLEITGKIKHEEQLTPDQEALVIKALKLASVLPDNLPKAKEEKQK